MQSSWIWLVRTMNSALTSDAIAESVLIDTSRLQREAMQRHEDERRKRWDMLTAKDLRRAAARNVSSAIRYARAGMSARLVNERLRRARHDWRLAREYEERANG